MNINISNINEQSAELLLEKTQELGLINHINKPTRITQTSATILDLIFSNVTMASCKILIGDISDHLTTIYPLSLNNSEQGIHEQTKRQLNPRTISNLIAHLDQEDWNDVIISHEPHKELHRLLQNYLNKACPCKTIKFNKNYCPIQKWMSPDILKLRKERNVLLKEAVITKDKNKMELVKTKTRQYNKTIRTAKKAFLEKKISENYGDSKKTWTLVNEYIRKKPSVSKDIKQIKTKNNSITTDPKQIAETLNDFYVSIGPALASEISQTSAEDMMPKKKNTVLDFKLTSTNEILKIIQTMKPKTSCGYDDFSNYLLRKIAPQIIVPLTHTINYCIKNAVFPDIWKIAKVIPIYKNKGSQEDCSNYRPISLLPTFSKVFEKVIDLRIREYMDKNNYWSPLQFGFRNQHETTHAIIRATHEILSAKQQNKMTLALFLDLKKAFDTVDHDRLIKKIELYGINSSLIKSYLCNRWQFTTVNNINSSSLKITCGVPQGSILGPLLFCLYANDLQEHVPFTSLLFADDTSLFFHGYDTNELIKNTNTGIIIANKWFSNNKLTVHADKTYYMVFNCKDRQNFNNNILWNQTKLQRAGKNELHETIRYVGIEIDEELSFKYHGQSVAQKIKSNSYLISTNKHFLPLSTRKLLYDSLILPHLQYGAEVWGTLNIPLITKLQKTIIRHVMKTNNFISHTNKQFIKLQTLKFTEIINYNLIRLCHKLVHIKMPPGLLDVFSQSTNTRRKMDLVTPKQNHCNSKELNLPTILAPKIWNALPTSMKAIIKIKTLKTSFYKETLKNYSNQTVTCPKNCPSCQDSQPLFT